MDPHPDARLAALAALQHGCLTVAQARSAGLSAGQIERRLARGTLVAPHRGVYVLAGAPPTWEQRVRAATLAARGLASHRTAAALWGLRGCERGAVEVTVAGRRRPGLAGVLAHSSTGLRPADRAVRSGIPLTGPERTLLDLGAVVAASVVESAVEDALFRRLTTFERLARAAAELAVPGRNGSAAFRQVIAGRDPRAAPTESPLEDAVVRLLRRGGLPEPERQVWLRPPGRPGSGSTWPTPTSAWPSSATVSGPMLAWPTCSATRGRPTSCSTSAGGCCASPGETCASARPRSSP